MSYYVSTSSSIDNYKEPIQRNTLCAEASLCSQPTQCWCSVEPTSQTEGHQCTNIGLLSLQVINNFQESINLAPCSDDTRP